MKSYFGKLCAIALLSSFVGLEAFSAALSGKISVHETGTTAAVAKVSAINGARRKIMINVLSKYADQESLVDLIQKSSDEDLTNMIVSSSVSNEHMSKTDYSASITMNLDNEAAKKWLDTNNVRNWVPLTDSGERFLVSVIVQNGVGDWAELNQIVHDDNLDFETQSITGNQVVAKLPASYRTKFTAAVREKGWQYSDNDGVLQIWK